MKFSEAASVFLSTKKFESFSQYTIDGYSIQYRLFIRDVGDVDIEDVTIHTLREHIAREGERLKVSSLQHKVRALKSLFSWLAEEEYLPKNPTTKLREPKGEKRIPKSLSFEEIELLRDSCQSPLEHALVEFFFATGCRVGEVYRLNRADIDFVHNSVQVIGKGDREREVYFGARAAIWLKRYLDSRTDQDPALFVTRNKPHRMPIHRIQDYFKAIGERCGLKDKVHPHVLRHSYAQTFLDNGAPLHDIQNLMGHQKPSTTLLYLEAKGKSRKQTYDRYFVQ